jgi:hypothetical protein
MLGRASASIVGLDVYADLIGDGLDAVDHRLDEGVAARDAECLPTGTTRGQLRTSGNERALLSSLTDPRPSVA